MEPFLFPPQSNVAPAHFHEPGESAPFIAPENSVSTSCVYSELERINAYYISKRRHLNIDAEMRAAFVTPNYLTSKLPTP